jgi:SPP1 family predicted phage head-tail adaptor
MIPTGLCTIYTLKNVAPEGRKPAEKLVELTTAYYAERTVGYNRYYAAAGANRRINMLIRLFNTSMVEEGMYVILEDGKQYQIDIAQKIIGKDAVDVTLVRVEDYYEVAE